MMFENGNLYAQSPDKKKNAEVQVEKYTPKKDNKKTSKVKKPQLNKGRMYTQTLEKKLIQGIAKTLKFLQQTVSQLPKRSAARLDMYLRILNLNLEQAAYIAGAEQDEFSVAWEKWDSNGRKGSEPQFSNKRSSAQWNKVYNLSKTILKEYPRSKHSDQIAFNSALSLQFLNRDLEASKELKALIINYPKSDYAGDAHFSLGDFYFDLNMFQKALFHYQESVKYKRSKRFGWALFKIAWSFYNLGQYQNALDHWKKTIIYSNKLGGSQGDRLKEECLRDMVYGFAEMRMTNEAIKFYKESGEEQYIPRFLKLLASIYSDQGLYKKSIGTWNILLRRYPDSIEAFDGQSEVIALMYELSDYNNMWRQIERIITKYGTSSSWYRENIKNHREEIEKVPNEIQEMAIYYPKLIHKEAQKERKNSLLAVARTGYQIYLKYFPESIHVPEVKEYLGDIYFFEKSYDLAGNLYMDIGLMPPQKASIFDRDGKPTQNIHRRSAKNMLDSYNKDFIPDLKTMMKKKPDFSKPKRVLTQKAKNFINSCELYMKWYPSDKEVEKNCETFISEIYYRSQDKEMSQKYLWLVAMKYPKFKEGESAVDNLIPLYLDNKNDLNAAVKKLLTVPEYNKGVIGKKLNLVVRGLKLENISNESSQYKRAKMYESTARSNPKDPDADKLWNNAAVDYLAAGAVESAIDAYTNIYKKYPNSKIHAESMLQAGKLYEQIFDMQNATAVYLAFASHYKSRKETPGALQRSCYIGIAFELNHAERNCKYFASKYPDGGSEAIKRLIDNSFFKKDFKKMESLITDSYIGKFNLSMGEKIESYYLIYNNFPKNSNHSKEAAKQILRLERYAKKISGTPLRFLAEVRFASLQSSVVRNSRLKLSGGDVNRLQSSLERKFNSLVNLENQFGKLFTIGDAYWAVAGFYQLGYAYEQFAENLRNPPSIKGAKKSELVTQLQPTIEQVLGKAIELYTNGIQTLRKFTVYTPWASKIYNSLNRVSNRNVTFDDIIPSVHFSAQYLHKELISQLKEEL